MILPKDFLHTGGSLFLHRYGMVPHPAFSPPFFLVFFVKDRKNAPLAVEERKENVPRQQAAVGNLQLVPRNFPQSSIHPGRTSAAAADCYSLLPAVSPLSLRGAKRRGDPSSLPRKRMRGAASVPHAVGGNRLIFSYYIKYILKKSRRCGIMREYNDYLFP